MEVRCWMLKALGFLPLWGIVVLWQDLALAFILVISALGVSISLYGSIFPVPNSFYKYYEGYQQYNAHGKELPLCVGVQADEGTGAFHVLQGV